VGGRAAEAPALWVYGAVKVGIPPQVFVIGTLIFIAGIALAIVNTILQRRSSA
jgi:spermidine/putrescine transport system permease protein